MKPQRRLLCRLMRGAVIVAGMPWALANTAQSETENLVGVMNHTVEASTSGREDAAGDTERRIHDDAGSGKRDLVRFMEDRVTYLVKDFTGEAHQRPEMGCELSDFGSWYDVAYSGGISRFWMNSVRHHTYDQVGFNAATDVGLLSLFFQTPSGELIDGSGGQCAVTWCPIWLEDNDPAGRHRNQGHGLFHRL